MELQCKLTWPAGHPCIGHNICLDNNSANSQIHKFELTFTTCLNLKDILELNRDVEKYNNFKQKRPELK